MASWSSPRGSVYRDASPTSPLTPLSPSSLPQWLRSKQPKPGVLPRSRLKLVLIACGCILFGWMLTSALGPAEDSALDLDETEPYDVASGGVLTDPSEYGISLEGSSKADGVIGNGDEESDEDVNNEDEVVKTKTEPSVTGALSELHHAVSDKLQSWNPYRLRPSQPAVTAGKSNKTSTKGQKKPASSAVSVPAGEHVKDGIKEEERLGARTRIGKATILFGGNSYWERAIRTHEEHDRIHGYRLHVLRQTLLDDVWSKPAYILSLLLRELAKPESERLEWLFWVDADTIILNPYIPIETFLPPPGDEFNDVHLIYCNDWNGLNNGVFPVRVSVWSVELFSAIVSYRHYRPEDPLIFRDQSAMNTLMQEPKFAKSVVQAPQRWFNAYQGEHNETLAPFQIRRGDLLVHFAGVPDRETRMGYWLKRAEKHLDDWEVPVKSTSYPEEASVFWQEQREARARHASEMVDIRVKATQLLSKTDQRLEDYGERITEQERNAIDEQQHELRETMSNPRWEDDPSKVSDATMKLGEACAPLMTAIAEGHKNLLQAAHDAIFAGEKDLLDGGFNSGITNAHLVQISERVKNLKNLVMSPEDFWNKHDITTATEAVTNARADLQEKTESMLAAANAEKAATAARAKALEDARKQVQAEAAAAAAEAGLSVSSAIVESASVSNVAPVQTVIEELMAVTTEAVVAWTTVVQETMPTEVASGN